MNPLHVGDPNAHPARPQVFNREYIVDLPSRRRKGAREAKKRWAVDMGGKNIGKFKTHTAAVKWATRKVREGRK